MTENENGETDFFTNGFRVMIGTYTRGPWLLSSLGCGEITTLTKEIKKNAETFIKEKEN